MLEVLQSRRIETQNIVSDDLMSVRLVVGLGNPGGKYRDTRHNIGARFVSMLADSAGLRLKQQSRISGSVARLSDSGVLLFIPSLWMNENGVAVAAICRRHDLLAEELLVVHDEMDFAPGIVRLKSGGGHGGHNGLRNIIKMLGSNDFYRLRLGIGRPVSGDDWTSYVLSKAPAGEWSLCKTAAERAQQILGSIFDGDWDSAVLQLHSF